MFPYPWKNSGKCGDTRDPREGFFSPRGKIPYFKIPTHLYIRGYANVKSFFGAMRRLSMRVQTRRDNVAIERGK